VSTTLADGPRPGESRPSHWYQQDWPLVIAAAAAYLATVRPHVAGGDAAEAFCIAASRQLGQLPCFFLHHLLATPLIALCSALGVAEEYGFNLLSLAAACGAVFFSRKLAEALGLGPRAAALCGLVTAFSGLFWLNAVNGDVYMLWTFFILGSFVAFERGRYIASGVWLGLAALTYAGAGYCLPYFLYYLARGPKTRRLGVLKVGVVAFALCLPLWVATYEEYFFGRMGILESAKTATENPHPAGALSELTKKLAFLGFGVLQSFNVLLPLLLVGGFLAFRRIRDGKLPFDVWIAIGLGSLYPTYLYTTMRAADDIYTLPFLPVLAALVALAADRVLDLRRGPALVVACGLGFVAFSGLKVVLPFGRALAGYYSLYRSLGSDPRFQRVNGQPRLFCTWTDTVLLNVVVARTSGQSLQYPDSMYGGPCRDFDQPIRDLRPRVRIRPTERDTFLLESARLSSLAQELRDQLPLPKALRRLGARELLAEELKVPIQADAVLTDSSGKVLVWQLQAHSPEQVSRPALTPIDIRGPRLRQ
jgi:hypothetical protein